MTSALEGLKVIEIAAIGPVPFAAMMLSDMGADITRIDRLPAPGARDDHSGGVENRGRKSIALNLKDPRGVELAIRLIEEADVLLEGFRPGVMEKLGLGPEVFQSRNPRLVYVRMTGWGQSGPLAHVAGHDINYIALTGALHSIGSSNHPPPPPLNLVGDYGGGALMMIVGVLASLYSRHESGRGQTVDVAMTDGTALMMTPFYSLLAQGKWRNNRQSNFLDGGAHFYNTYECSDGRFISIGSIEPQFYRVLMEKLGIDSPAFLNQHCEEAWPSLRAQLADIFLSRTRDQWTALLEGTEACFAPILDMHETPLHPHNVARQTFVEYKGAMQPAPAPRFKGTPSTMQTHAPTIGEDTIMLLAAMGMQKEEMEGLIVSGVAYAKK